MASYLLAAIALTSSLIETLLAPVARAAVSTCAGMALASLYLIPAVWEKDWMSIQYAVTPSKYLVENNWLLGRHADPFLDISRHDVASDLAGRCRTSDFPEPDLPPLIVSAEFLSETRKKLPELPEARRARMIAEYELSLQDAHTLTASREFADRFEAAAKTARNPRRVANVLLSEVGGRLKALGLEEEQSPVSMAGIVLAADLLDEGKISSKQMKQLFDLCFEKGEDFGPVYEREKPQQITDAAAIEKLIDEVIAANPKQVEQYRAGKKTMAGFFVGQVMRASKGQANPALLNELMTKKLEG